MRVFQTQLRSRSLQVLFCFFPTADRPPLPPYLFLGLNIFLHLFLMPPIGLHSGRPMSFLFQNFQLLFSLPSFKIFPIIIIIAKRTIIIIIKTTFPNHLFFPVYCKVFVDSICNPVDLFPFISSGFCFIIILFFSFLLLYTQFLGFSWVPPQFSRHFSYVCATACVCVCADLKLISDPFHQRNAHQLASSQLESEREEDASLSRPW